MSQEAFEKRRKAQKWRRIRRWLLGICGVALVGGAVWLVWFSHVLVATKVVVTGQTSLRAASIRQHADVPLGLQLARLDAVAIEARVARMERIDTVDVRRRWPHTVVIEVKERKPIGWVMSEGVVRYVDRTGVDFRTVPKKPDNLLELRIGTLDPLTRQQALEAVGSVVSYLRTHGRDVLVQTRYVKASTQDSVELRLTGRRTVVWGSAEHNDAKLTVLRPLLRRVDAERYDVSAPKLPTTKSANAGG